MYTCKAPWDFTSTDFTVWDVVFTEVVRRDGWRVTVRTFSIIHNHPLETKTIKVGGAFTPPVGYAPYISDI